MSNPIERLNAALKGRHAIESEPGERFLVEIETTANLRHTHLLPPFDSGAADGFLYDVMPHVGR